MPPEREEVIVRADVVYPEQTTPQSGKHFLRRGRGGDEAGDGCTGRPHGRGLEVGTDAAVDAVGKTAGPAHFPPRADARREFSDRRSLEDVPQREVDVVRAP